MKDSTYDQLLVTLALLAPLALFALSKWRASLDTWYAPLDRPEARYLDSGFEHKLSHWLRDQNHTGAQLLVITDRDCPCTRATLVQLHAALAQSRRPDVRLVMRDVRDPETNSDPAWRQLLRDVPSTPTLLAIDGQRLLYAGPVTSGNFCTTAVNRVLGITTLQSPQHGAIFNLIDKGCYCRMPASS